mgnify:CR=1 FL=1
MPTRTAIFCSIATILTAFTQGPTAATVQYFERSDTQIPVTTIAGSGSYEAGFYGPSVVLSLDGQKSFLYMMGGDGEGFGTRCDSVYVYEHPATFAGLNSAYVPTAGTPKPNGRILPDESSTNPLINQIGPAYCYGAPAAWTDVNAPTASKRYRMTAPKPSNDDFSEILYGVSTNGVAGSGLAS